jgi:hypothetical protein
LLPIGRFPEIISGRKDARISYIAQEYTQAAKDFARATGRNFTVAKIGNTYFKYDHDTGNLLIVNGKDRVIKTFYTTDEGLASFKRAMQQHIEVLRSQGHDL